jgi:pyruvate/2-oxoglutarate dehydrogenase complex dihydrolipoamide acyltransferase (E2) component
MLEVRVPQLGEGLREVRIVELVRQPGDAVCRGDTLYIVETDKSTVELESPDDGRLLEWRVTAGDVVAIGKTVAIIDDLEDRTRLEPAPPPPRRLIPPRTRAHARAKGLSATELRSIPCASEKLLPADIDAYLADAGREHSGDDVYHDYTLGAEQRALIYRLRRSAAVVIPGSVAIDIPADWLRRDRLSPSSVRPTPFQVFGHAIAHVASSRAKFRSIMVSDDRVREFPAVNVGLALARPNDVLITAVVRAADRLGLPEFVRACTQQMKMALRHGDQATSDMQILLTQLAEFNIVDAAPTLVAPASTVFFLGAQRRETKTARIVLTFDHRLINGAAAATFLVALSNFLGDEPPSVA